MINLVRSAAGRWPAIIIAVLLITSCTEEPVGGSSKGAAPEDRAGNGALYGLTAQVSLPDESGSPADTAMVYVFLREPGSRMPLAVQQFSAGELPRSVNFSGGQSGPLELVARLSPRGRVDPGPDDVEIVRSISGLSHPPQNYALVLDRTVRDGASEPAVTPVSTKTEPSTFESVAIPVLVDIEGGHSFTQDTVVFLVARDPGKPMPVAVKRLSVADLPARIELSDEHAMMVSYRLSDAERVSLFARISTAGTVTLSKSDWVSETVQVRPAAGFPDRLKLTISPPVTR